MRHMLSLGRWGPRRTWHRSRGQSLVELALILPVMMLLFAGALDLGRIYYSQITIENAAKEGALEAARNPTSFDNTKPCDKDTNRVLCLVLNEAKGSMYEITAADVTLTCSPSTCPTTPALGDTVTVTVVGHFTLLTPVLAQIVGPQVTLSASSVAQLGVEPEPGLTTTSTTTTSTTTTSTTTTSTTTTSTTTICVTPVVPAAGKIDVSPNAGTSSEAGTGTLFTFTAPSATPQAGCAFTYTWSFGDGGSASGESVAHTYAHPGNTGNGQALSWTVTLVISTSGGAQPWVGTAKVRVDS